MSLKIEFNEVSCIRCRKFQDKSRLWGTISWLRRGETFTFERTVSGQFSRIEWMLLKHAVSLGNLLFAVIWCCSHNGRLHFFSSHVTLRCIATCSLIECFEIFDFIHNIGEECFQPPLLLLNRFISSICCSFHLRLDLCRLFNFHLAPNPDPIYGSLPLQYKGKTYRWGLSGRSGDILAETHTEAH